MTKTCHMKIDLRGALVNWEDCSWQGCCHTDDGRLMSPAEVKAVFLDKLALGDRFYPMGPGSTEEWVFRDGRNLQPRRGVMTKESSISSRGELLHDS
jgi:hypothetical protein